MIKITYGIIIRYNSGIFTFKITGIFMIWPIIVAVYNEAAKKWVPKRTNGNVKVSIMK